MPASHAFEKIEANGVYIDIDRFFALEKKLLKDQERLDAELQALAPINWRSTKQVADVLYNQWHLQIIERTDTGAPSTAEPVIKRLKGQHPGVATLLEYRTTTKTISSFIEGWKKFIGADNRMHPTFNIWGTKTGRLSCADPNLQQVPKDKDIRSLVTAPPGWTFIEADLSQIELRIAAMLAREPTMIAIYKEGKIDLHTYTASIISGKSVDEVTKADRSAAKPVNFGLLYGMQAPTLKEYAYVNYEMELTLEDAVEFREKFFQAYSGLLAWHEEQKQEVRTFGCVKTPVGRIRHLPAIYGDRKAQAEAERQAINSPVQSFGSDMCVSAIIQLANTLDPAEARIVGNVHDAILLEVRNDKVDEVAAKVKAAMEAPDIILKKFGVKFPLPIEAEVKISPDGWGTERKEPKKPETPGMPDLCEVCKERPATDQFTFEDGQKLWLCVVCLESAENSM
jgi:DNA polymerase-1